MPVPVRKPQRKREIREGKRVENDVAHPEQRNRRARIERQIRADSQRDPKTHRQPHSYQPLRPHAPNVRERNPPDI